MLDRFLLGGQATGDWLDCQVEVRSDDVGELALLEGSFGLDPGGEHGFLLEAAFDEAGGLRWLLNARGETVLVLAAWPLLLWRCQIIVEVEVYLGS